MITRLVPWTRQHQTCLLLKLVEEGPQLSSPGWTDPLNRPQLVNRGLEHSVEVLELGHKPILDADRNSGHPFQNAVAGRAGRVIEIGKSINGRDFFRGMNLRYLQTGQRTEGFGS